MPRQANRFGGGANTNRNGLHFEQTTSLNTALQNAGFIIANHFEVYDRNQLLGYSINQDEFSTIFLRQNGINDRAINSKRWKPDEAFINEIDKTVYIIEKKFQHTSGSVDEKLATFPFKIREYRRLLDPIGYDLVYIYLLSSDWFNVPKYQDYYDYMDELAEQYPQYDWKSNKGYPTKKHRAAIKEYGITPFHRKSYNLLGDGQLSFEFK